MSALVHTAFSFGRDRDLVHRIQDSVPETLTLHDLQSDLDANRTWLSISGEHADLIDHLLLICRMAFDRIDLQRQSGWHPRVGALDQCDFVGAPLDEIQDFAEAMAQAFSLPVYLANDDAAWREIRELGFGGLLDRPLLPSYGPLRTHEKLGICGVGLRRFFLTIAATFEEDYAHFCQSRVRDIDQRREDGEPIFEGVTAIGYPMPSYGASRMVIEFGNPDSAPPDPVLEWLDRKSKVAGVPLKGFGIIGAMRRSDLLETRNVPYRPDQLVESFELKDMLR